MAGGARVGTLGRVLWTDIPVHVIDFEGSRETGIVEFGVVTLRGGVIADVTTRLCGARGRIGAEDVRVHGLQIGRAHV